jgi:ABC-2 type transport system ATP-binding protein
MSEYAIEIDNLSKLYTNNGIEKSALTGLNLSIRKGSIFGLLGPNGAGKSTLINILAGTIIKTSGTVKMMGINIDDSPKWARKNIGVVPQEIYVDTFFTLYKGLEFMAGYYGVKVDSDKINQLLTALGLYEKRYNFPTQLSGGMKRRFLIAKAMIHEPPILVLDEPTAGVDIELREDLWNYVRFLNQKGVTIVITTHYLMEAQTLCDEIAFIDQGKIIVQDTTSNLLKTMGNRYLDVEFTEEVSNEDVHSITKICEVQFIASCKVRIFLPENIDISNLLESLLLVKRKIKDMEVVRSDLEDVFKRVIHHN